MPDKRNFVRWPMPFIWAMAFILPMPFRLYGPCRLNTKQLFCFVWDKMAISDEEIIKLWKNIDFSGSYRGISTFKILLKTDLGIDVSVSRLYRVLQNEPIFLMHQRKYKPVKRRTYITHSYGALVQGDCAYMTPDETTSKKFFFLVVDVYR